jgi:lipoate-protein ligase A
LIKTLSKMGVDAYLCESPDRRPVSEQPFLCFQRRSIGDVLAGGEKIVGSAQRRHKTAILQHGSVLLRRSAYAPELPGLANLAGRDVDQRSFASQWIDELVRQMDMEFTEETLSPSESAAAKSLATKKFANEDWTRRR